MESILGYIQAVTYQHPETGFTVARLKEAHKNEPTVVVGKMPSVRPGETIRCEGSWKNNPKFGLRFEVSDYSVERPSDAEGIRKYLASGLLKGIGPVIAERIVDRFGEKTLEVIDAAPERLLEVNGIGRAKAERIRECWGEQKAVREVMLFLQRYHVTPAYAQKIYRCYREDSIARIEANPYDLARDVHGIGFKTADAIAQNMGVPRDSPRRLDAGIEYALSELASAGHTCFPRPAFEENAAHWLECDRILVSDRLEQSILLGRIVKRALDPSGEESVWLPSFDAAENGIAQELSRLLGRPQLPFFPIPPSRLEEIEAELGIRLAEQQRAAVCRCMSDKVNVLTGGPGTGKSTITKAVLAVWARSTKRILLAAPTGRAAKRMTEITGREAFTLHHLLEFDYGTNGFRRNRNHPLEVDLMIVDESSMVDTALMNSLMQALPTSAHLLLVGDVDQLPSVGAGKVLEDLIDSGTVPVTRLTEIFRQAASSRIVTNAHSINRGEMPDLVNRSDGDFFFMEKENPEEIVSLIADLVAERLPRTYGFDPVEDIQVLCPMKVGPLGTIALNERLQQRLNPDGELLQRGTLGLKIADKVMQLRNNYSKSVYNGDVGRVRSIDVQEQTVSVAFDREAVEYDFSDLDELSLSYAVSVHKYQGSECPCVVMPVHNAHSRMLSRNLLYTGITRGKKLVVLVGARSAIERALRNTAAFRRHSGLVNALERAGHTGAVLGDPIVVPWPIS
jgi:exodeoxyribonuclease V alpha subunit